MIQQETYGYYTKKGVIVERRNYEDIENLIKRFNKKVSKSGILKELQNRTFFEKPSSIKRRKKILAIKTIKREREKN